MAPAVWRAEFDPPEKKATPKIGTTTDKSWFKVISDTHRLKSNVASEDVSLELLNG